MQNKPKAKIIIFHILCLLFRFYFYYFILSFSLLLAVSLIILPSSVRFVSVVFCILFWFRVRFTLDISRGVGEMLLFLYLLLSLSLSLLLFLLNHSSLFPFIPIFRGRTKKMPIRHQQSRHTFKLLVCRFGRIQNRAAIASLRLMSTLTMPMPMQMSYVVVWVREAGDFTMFKAIGVCQSRI